MDHEKSKVKENRMVVRQEKTGMLRAIGYGKTNYMKKIKTV